jgi:hypothetical protein
LMAPANEVNEQEESVRVCCLSLQGSIIHVHPVVECAPMRLPPHFVQYTQSTYKFTGRRVQEPPPSYSNAGGSASPTNAAGMR